MKKSISLSKPKLYKYENLFFHHMYSVFLFFLSCEQANLENIENEVLTEGEYESITYYDSLVSKSITFENGKILNLLIGDSAIYLDEDILLNKNQLRTIELNNSRDSNARTFITDLAKYWTSGNVYYKINSTFSSTDRNTIINAINDWRNKTSLRFTERTSQSNYIEFMPSTVNNSYLGMIGGRQVINLAVTVSSRAAIHEIGHAVGFFHEQSRNDRDNFIIVNWDNIKPTFQFAFETYGQRGIPGTQIGSFDFNSVMLYSSRISDPNFVYNTSIPVLTRLDGTTWATSFNLSYGDIESSKFIYGPPFARIEKEITYSYDNGDEEIEVADIAIAFYSDQNCTIPLTLNNTIVTNLRFYSNINGSIANSYITKICNSGSHRFIIEENVVTENKRYDYGDLVNSEVRDYYLRNGFKR